MTFYLTPAGNQHRTLQGRPVLAVPTAAKDGYLSFPQQSAPPSQQHSYLVPVVVQPQPYHRQPIASNYPRFLIQQPSPLTKMITQNYLAIAKQMGPRVQTRLNTYSPQYKHLPPPPPASPLDLAIVKQQQQFNDQPQIIYKQQHQQLHEEQEPVQFKQQVQEPIIYGQQLPDDNPIIYKPQSDESQPNGGGGGSLYKTSVTPQPQQLHHSHKVVLPPIPPEILTQFKPQDAIIPPLQYKKLLQAQAAAAQAQVETPKQYYIVRRPTVQQQHIEQPPEVPQQQFKESQDDGVTITQSQELDVSTLPQEKYHAKYAAPKPTVVTISKQHYPISYQQHEEYDTAPLLHQSQLHHPEIQNEQRITESSEEDLHDEQTFDEDIRDGDLNNILGGFSLAKSLPEKITPENLDSSIKTLSKLLRILQRANALPHSAKTIVSNLPRPHKEHAFNVKVPKYHKISPSDQEGGTPGRAGVDYPAYDEIPPTHFSCKQQRYKGFFGDPETGCQVWHYCDLNGGQASFLCPNGTIFSQVALTCDWWFNVKCASTAQLYVLNERLYKYILPQKLSFPEDFQGPLVDQYLTLKFREIEEKNKNKTEEATKSSKPKDDDDKDKDNDDDDDEEEEEELELPYSEDVATSQNKVRSIPKSEIGN